ncbi:MAG: hypothetical protein JXQ71_04490 [Verrucomicrobia bacterium]|nr:hypothetical protein [Verrucomicrobiota bacterium]
MILPPNRPATPARRAHGPIAALALAACLGMLACLNTPAAPAAPDPAARAKHASPAAKALGDNLSLVRSVFDDSFKSGRDPFFPNTERARTDGQTNQVVLQELTDLTLRGIVISPTRRLAIINRYSLAEGETCAIRKDNRVYEVHCIEVREKSAVISIRNQRRTLFLLAGHGT